MRDKPAGIPRRIVKERGIVLIAVLIFMAAIVPITILILDSVRIESLMPVNENYVEIAEWQADLGFYEAISLIIEDEQLVGVDPSKKVPVNLAAIGDYLYEPDPAGGLGTYQFASWPGSHDLDYLAEPWARHPDNDTCFLVERSLENIENALNVDSGSIGTPEAASVPARWQFQNIPLGLDDFGELVEDPQGETNEPGLMPDYENLNPGAADQRVPIGNLRTTPISILDYDPSDANLSYSWPIVRYANINNDWATEYANEFWMESPADHDYIWPNKYPRPASYFRNNQGVNGYTPDNLVYDSLFDGDNTTNQYLASAELQEAVTNSTWANIFFGNSFTNNKEYKPRPGSIFPSPLGTEGEILPSWHESIVSDESGRFPINLLLNIIFSSQNFDYTDDGDLENPVVERDQWDTDVDYDFPITDTNHPNHDNYLLARDMVISLLMTDADLRDIPPGSSANAYARYADEAEWLIRQMLYKRASLDLHADYNGDGTWDATRGEQNYLAVTDNMDGNGRRGDANDMWDGTWDIYSDPKNILSDYAQDSLPFANARPTLAEFERLNQRITVYSFETEVIADFQESPPARDDFPFLRLNINRMLKKDDGAHTLNYNEQDAYDKLRAIVGQERADSILRWRDGLVDLNGDGDLNDEYLEQPIKEPTSDEPVSTLTYRERNHPNFQDPAALLEVIQTPPTPNRWAPANTDFDPDYMNIPSLSSLLTIPMSVQSEQILYSDYNGSTFDIYRVDPAMTPVGTDDIQIVNGASDYIYPNLDPFGAHFAVQDPDNIERYETNGGIFIDQPVNNALHPSYNHNGTRICYTRDAGGARNIYTSDPDGANETMVLNAPFNIPDDADLSGLFGGIIGLPPVAIAGPDFSPSSGRPDWIVYSAGPDSPDFLNTQHRIMLTNANGDYHIPRTGGANGIHDICPVFTPDASWIIFIRIDLSGGSLPGNPNPGTLIDDLRTMFYLMAVPAQGGGGPRRIILRDPENPVGADPDYRLVMPLLPTVSPDGFDIAFCAFDYSFAEFLDNVLEGTPILPPLANPGIDIYRIPMPDLGNLSAIPPYSEFMAQRLVDSGDVLSSFPNPPTEGIAWCPDWGNGPILPARSGDTDDGGDEAIAIALSGYDPLTEREELAAELQEASCALRAETEQPLMSYYTQWQFKDFPAVCTLQVQALQKIMDRFCVRDPETFDPGNNPFNPFDDYVLQAYGPKININTASRPVMRTIFLLMFQGPVWDNNFNGNTAGPAPRGVVGGLANIQPINLLDDGLSNADRLLAIRIADTYAYQVDEFRKWTYNNQGLAGITEETVPDSVAILMNETGSGRADSRFNYRANSFHPITAGIDDGSGHTTTVYKPFFDPAPPFRSTADLFSVMLYSDINSSPWRDEGIDSSNGPARTDMPEAIDTSSGSGYNRFAQDIWGPIFVEEGNELVTHGGELDGFPNVELSGFTNYRTIGPSPPLADINDLKQDQLYRMFSVDDFKRIEPYLTTRTYVYRVESRGVVRIASGVNRMDVSRDKFWIVSVNRDAYAGIDTDGDPYDLDGNAYDGYYLFRADDTTEQYTILTYEDFPQGGFKLTRNNFVPMP